MTPADKKTLNSALSSARKHNYVDMVVLLIEIITSLETRITAAETELRQMKAGYPGYE